MNYPGASTQTSTGRLPRYASGVSCYAKWVTDQICSVAHKFRPLVYLACGHTLRWRPHCYVFQLTIQNNRRSTVARPIMPSWPRGAWQTSCGLWCFWPPLITRTMRWRWLDQEVNVILIGSYFQEPDPVISGWYARAYLHERFVYSFCKYYPTVFCRTYKVVNQITYVMRCLRIIAFWHFVTHPSAASNEQLLIRHRYE